MFDSRATEISLVIKQTFESVIMTHLFPNSQIDIFIQILQADGGNYRNRSQSIVIDRNQF